MLFGMQRNDAKPEQILAAQNRLQSRLEADPSVTSMQPGGLIPLDITGGRGLAQPLPQPSPQPQGNAPFQWGAGGSRITPDALNARRKFAQQQTIAGMDTSPVGSWTQGAARVAQALMGGLEERSLDKAAKQNTDYEQQILQNLAGTGGGAGNDPATLSAMSSPYVSDGTKEALKLQWSANHKTPAAPHYFETNNGSQGMIGADGKPQIIYKDPDPKMNFIPDGMGGGNWVPIPSLGSGGDVGASLPPAPVGRITPVGKITPIGGGAPSQGGATFLP